MDRAAELKFIADLARSAGKVALQYFGHVDRLTKTHSMTTDEAVTEGDRATQRHIVAALRQTFPGDNIIGEENDTGSAITAEIGDPDGRTWVIDPIDGTNNYISGIGLFCVCIGLLDHGRPVLGVVYDVTRDIAYAGAEGHGAFANERPIAALTTPMSNASVLMLTSNLLDKAGRCPGWAVHWIGQTDWKVRMLGSAALEAVHVAAGLAHGAVTVNGKLWDCVAPAAIVLEAGGRVVDLHGNDVFPFDLRNYQGARVPFASTAPGAHDELMRELRTYA